MPDISKPKNDPRRGDDISTVAYHEAGQAQNDGAIKAAKNRGVNPGISIESGRMIPPPPSYDPFNGKRCGAPGKVKNGWGAERICGRQATATLTVSHFELDAPKSPSRELADEALAYMAYGATSGPNPFVAASGPVKGRLIAEPGTVGPNSKFVCGFHAMAAYRETLHPEDSPEGRLPDQPKITGEVIFGLDKLNPGRPFRCVGQDASFAWVTDGKVTVMCHKRDYIALLAEFGLLPDDPMVPLP